MIRYIEFVVCPKAWKESRCRIRCNG